MMKIRQLATSFVFAAFVGAPILAWAVSPQPLYVVDLSSLTPAGAASANGLVTFLTDHSLAVGMCHKSTCNVETFDLSTGHASQIGLLTGIDRFGAIVRAADGQVILSGMRRGGKEGAIMLDQYLQKSQSVQQLPEMRDLVRKVRRKYKKPSGSLGWRTRLTADGSRLLYDSFTRRVGLAQTIKEDLLIVPTMGMSGDGDIPNGEVVRVIDTSSRKKCFEWHGRDNLLPPFKDHADIDPSGRLVAILTWETVSIFELPQTCTNK